MEDSERMREDNELFYRYLSEAKATAWIGPICAIVGYLASIQRFSLDAQPYGSFLLYAGLIIFVIGTPYYVIKAYIQRKKIMKEWGYVREY